MNTRIRLITLLAALWQSQAWASYAIYVGKDLTADGSVMIGGSGDEVSSHWLEVVPAAEHKKQRWALGMLSLLGVAILVSKVVL